MREWRKMINEVCFGIKTSSQVGEQNVNKQSPLQH